MDDAWARRISIGVSRGDRSALAALYEARYAMLLRIVRRRTMRDEAFACDCVHDAWLRVFRRMPTFERIANLDAWLVRVALSAALDRIKSERARALREATIEGPRGAMLPDELLQRLTAEIDRMSQEDQEVLHLRFWRDRPLRAIAESLGVGVRTAESRLRRAMERLRAGWKEMSDE